MPDLLVDTDLFIDHLRGAAELKPGKHRLHYSLITRAELFAGSSATAQVSQLLAPFRELPVDRAVAERAGRIKREGGLRMPDALIAATAGARIEPGDQEPPRPPARTGVAPTRATLGPRSGPRSVDMVLSLAPSGLLGG